MCASGEDSGVVEVANYQLHRVKVVYFGDATGIEKAFELAREAGAKRVMPST